MSIYQKLWSDYQKHTFKTPILNAHYKSKNIGNSVPYLFLVSSIFEKISDRAITLNGDIPITVVTTLFYECSHPDSRGVFEISLSGKACIGFDKNCFIKCQSPNVGVGSAKLENQQCLSVIDCVISQSGYQQQSDTFSVHNGIQYYKSFNSSYNEIRSAPHITSVGAFSCELKYCIVSHNSALLHGGMYIGSESMLILLCSFMSNSMSDGSEFGMICAYNSEVTVVSSDISQNKGRLLSTVEQSFITCKQCFFNSNSESPSYPNVVIETTSTINKEEIWIVDHNVCHQMFPSCREGRRRRQMIFLSFVMSE